MLPILPTTEAMLMMRPLRDFIITFWAACDAKKTLRKEKRESACCE